MHKEGVVHRDIKPDNLYVRADGHAEELVVGDFDISSVLDTARTSRDTQRLAGTWVYSAPEAFPRFVESSLTGLSSRVSAAADYYSLGVTIVELIAGTTSLHACELPDLFDFYLQGGRVAIPEDLPPRLTMLLRGLLIRNRQARWGAEEIARWLAGTSTPEDQRRIIEDQTYELSKATQPYRLEDKVVLDLPALAEAMSECQESATADLLGGEVMVNWIGLLDANVARDIQRDRERLRHHPSVALYAAIVRCDPTRPFVFPPHTEAITHEDLIEAAVALLQGENRAAVEEVGGEEALRCLAEWFRCKIDPEADLADRCEAIANRKPGEHIALNARVRLAELLYLVDMTRPYLVAEDAEPATPQALARLAYGAASDWDDDGLPAIYAELHRQWLDGYVGAWLRQRGLETIDATAEAALDKAPEARYAAFEGLLHALDPALPPVAIELSSPAIDRGLRVPYGETAIGSLQYRVVGPGMPFGALVLTADHAEIRLGNERLVCKREGYVQILLDGKGKVPASHTSTAQLIIDGENCVLRDGPVTMRYEVTMPILRTIQRIGIGAFLGGAILGGSRLLLACLGHPNPVDVREISAG